MTTTIKTETTLEYRMNNAYDSILSVKDGMVVNRTTVTQAVFAEFAKGGFDATDWDGQEDIDDATDPADYGDLLAIYDESLRPVDARRWADRVEFYTY